MKILSLLVLLLPFNTFADEVESPHHARFAAAIGPAWTHVLRDNYVGGFSPYGFNTPGRDRLGMDLLGYWTTPTNWQLGLALTSLSFEQDSGAYAADYSNDVVGLYVAKNFSPDAEYDLTVGTLLGVTASELTVFSPSRNGRLHETAAVVGPSVGYATRLTEHVKAGLRFTYYLPFGESSQLKGQDLGVSKIAVRGFAVALDVIFGRF